MPQTPRPTGLLSTRLPAELVRVQPGDLFPWWPQVRPFVAVALEELPGFTEADVFRVVNDGKWILWIAKSDRIEAVLVGEIEYFPRETQLFLRICVGNEYHRWIHLLAQVEAYAKGVGCKRVMPACRPGWEPILKKLGYRKTHVIMEKPV